MCFLFFLFAFHLLGGEVVHSRTFAQDGLRVPRGVREFIPRGLSLAFQEADELAADDRARVLFDRFDQGLLKPRFPIALDFLRRWVVLPEVEELLDEEFDER